MTQLASQLIGIDQNAEAPLRQYESGAASNQAFVQGQLPTIQAFDNMSYRDKALQLQQQEQYLREKVTNVQINGMNLANQQKAMEVDDMSNFQKYDFDTLNKYQTQVGQINADTTLEPSQKYQKLQELTASTHGSLKSKIGQTGLQNYVQQSPVIGVANAIDEANRNSVLGTMKNNVQTENDAQAAGLDTSLYTQTPVGQRSSHENAFLNTMKERKDLSQKLSGFGVKKSDYINDYDPTNPIPDSQLPNMDQDKAEELLKDAQRKAASDILDQQNQRALSLVNARGEWGVAKEDAKTAGKVQLLQKNYEDFNRTSPLETAQANAAIKAFAAVETRYNKSLSDPIMPQPLKDQISAEHASAKREMEDTLTALWAAHRARGGAIPSPEAAPEPAQGAQPTVPTTGAPAPEPAQGAQPTVPTTGAPAPVMQSPPTTTPVNVALDQLQKAQKVQRVITAYESNPKANASDPKKKSLYDFAKKLIGSQATPTAITPVTLPIAGTSKNSTSVTPTPPEDVEAEPAPIEKPELPYQDVLDETNPFKFKGQITPDNVDVPRDRAIPTTILSKKEDGVKTYHVVPLVSASGEPISKQAAKDSFYSDPEVTSLGGFSTAAQAQKKVNFLATDPEKIKEAPKTASDLAFTDSKIDDTPDILDQVARSFIVGLPPKPDVADAKQLGFVNPSRLKLYQDDDAAARYIWNKASKEQREKLALLPVSK